MNVERLHEVAVTIVNEYQELQVSQLFSSLLSALQSSISQPNPQTAEAFDSAWASFREALTRCPSNNFGPSRARILETIAGEPLVGNDLAERIDTIIEEERITPAGALDSLTKLSKGVGNFINRLSSLRSALETLHIPASTIAEEEAEIGVLLPESLLDNEIEPLTKELRQLDRHLRFFAELTGTRVGSLQIKDLSSGSVDVFLGLDPGAAACLMVAVERIVALYKKILEIRLLQSKLEELGLPKAKTSGIKDHEEEVIKKELDKLGAELFKGHAARVEGSRKHELQTGLRMALEYLADRIDRGVDVEATMPPAPSKEAGGEAEEGGSGTGKAEPREVLIRASLSVRMLERAPEPVLRLAPPDMNTEDEGDVKGEKKPKK